MTAYRERRLLDGLQKAVMTDIMPAASSVAGVCDICESDIEIGTSVVTLPGPKKSTFTVCGDCFELYRLCPGPRPMV